jgi:predicted phage baseplate assembly protein
MTLTAPDTNVAMTDRRREIKARRHNGLDFVEVDDSRRQLTLMFLGAVPQPIGLANILIEGLVGQPRLEVSEVRRVGGSDPVLRDHLQATLSEPGGNGPYRVSVVEPRPDGRPGRTPLRGLDPRFTGCTIRFNIDEPNPPVAAAEPSTAERPAPAAAATYLARDYQGLKQALLHRLSQTMPDVSAQHVPDLMVTFVELFAYIGDDLSYYQDAVATEAYLETARRRTSIRRHSRLVGYRFHEGCHARSWLDIQVSDDLELALNKASFAADANTRTLTFTPVRAALPPAYPPDEANPPHEALGPIVPLRLAHNQIQIWIWGAHTTKLPRGATEATLAEPVQTLSKAGGRSLRLEPGDVLLFEELHDADDGPPDETHRHVVRLTSVQRDIDPLFDRPVLNVKWDALDALPFDLPLNDRSPFDAGRPAARAVARANLVLVGEGKKVVDEPLEPGEKVLKKPDLTWSCPHPDLGRVAVNQAAALRNLYQAWRARVTEWMRRAQRGQPMDSDQRAKLIGQIGDEIAGDLRLVAESTTSDQEQAVNDAIGLWVLLARADELLEDRRRRLDVLSRLAAASGPLSGPMIAELHHDWGETITHALGSHHPASWGPAVDATTQDPTRARPLLALTQPPASESQSATRWEVTTGLVDAEPEQRRAIVEMDNDRTAQLRFNPLVKPTGTLLANYVVGNGAAGNVAAEMITWAGAQPDQIVSVRNPLPATGGVDPEPMDQARRAIPGSYLSDQPRALTPADYVAIAKAVPGVRNAAAVLQWNGNRLRVRVAVQPTIGREPMSALLHRVEFSLVVARRIGHELDVTPPDYFPVAMTVTVDLDANTVRDNARHSISGLLSGGRLDSGEPAFFHPSHFSLGDSLYRSALVAAVQDVAGVDSVIITDLRFMRPPVRTQQPSDTGLAVPATGIIRCDNDPSARQHGYVVLKLVGGR